MTVKERYHDLQVKIEESCKQSGREPREVRLIAVTKYVSASTASQALACGVRHLGENRLEGLLEKQKEIGREIIH